MRKVLIVALLLVLPTISGALEVPVFDQAVIHFTPDDSSRYDSRRVIGLDNGRVARTRISLPGRLWQGKIYGRLLIEPSPMDSDKVWDKWDRAGNIRLAQVDKPDLELIKFVTAYGGPTEYRVELSHLAPQLRGTVDLRAFIDTWSSPGWRVSLTLEYTNEHNPLLVDWIVPLIYEESITAKFDPIVKHVDIPDSTYRIELHYLVSGHCTDGTDEDEFESKFNVVKVDGREVLRYKPWRNDCTDFRDINPFTRHWPDGTWSSDYSRSGWCPGDWVRPLVTDLRKDLTPGPHEMQFSIEDVRPRDENDHYGYWRVSAYLVGWKE